MAGCQIPSRETSSQPHSLAADLRVLYPQCDITEIPYLRGYTLLSVQPSKDTDLKLEFRIPGADSQEISFLSVASKSLTKKDLQRLQRSLELQMAISASGQMVEEALNVVHDFIEEEGSCDKNNSLSGKNKNKKSKIKNKEEPVKNIEKQNHESDKIGLKVTRKREKRRLRNLDEAEDSEDSFRRESTLRSLCGPDSQEKTCQEVICTSLPLLARPTHFIAVRVMCRTILAGLTAAQQELVSREPLLEKGAFAPEIFHLTLFTLGLDSPEDVESCIQALRTMRTNLEKSRPLHPFVIHGMSQFYNRAIFAKVKFKQDFIDFREHMRNELESFNVEIRDMYEKFNPHLTIIKVKRPERKLFGPRNIQPAIYSHLTDTVFGEQRVDDIHLCPMDGQRREDGFYTSLFEIKFGS